MVIAKLFALHAKHCKGFDIHNTELDKALPIGYWSPGMHNKSVDVRFTVASRGCSAKPLSNAVSRIWRRFWGLWKVFMTKGSFIGPLTALGGRSKVECSVRARLAFLDLSCW